MPSLFRRWVLGRVQEYVGKRIQDTARGTGRSEGGGDGVFGVGGREGDLGGVHGGGVLAISFIPFKGPHANTSTVTARRWGGVWPRSNAVLRM